MPAEFGLVLAFAWNSMNISGKGAWICWIVPITTEPERRPPEGCFPATNQWFIAQEGSEQGPLGRGQVEQYERDGFLWLDRFFPEHMVSPFFDELDEMASDRAFCEREEVIMDQNREKIRSVFPCMSFLQHSTG